MKTFKKAIIFDLPSSILKGIGRGIEVIPTTISYAKRIVQGDSYGSTEPNVLIIHDPSHDREEISENVNIDLSNKDIIEVDELSFDTNLSYDETYSEFLYITNNFTEFYLVRSL